MDTGIVCLGIVAILPVTLYLGAGKVHVLRDAEYMRLLTQIDEFKSIREIYGDSVVQGFLGNHLLLPFFLLAAVVFLLIRKINEHEIMVLWLGIVMTAAMLFLSLHQQRWFCFYAAFNIWLMILVIPVGSNLFAKATWHGLALAALVVITFFVTFPLFGKQARRMEQLSQGKEFVQQVGKPILIKRFALALGDALRGQDTCAMADPGLAAPLYYFGGIKTIGSFYWEDIEGLHDTTAFFDATDEATAIDIARRRGITHIIMSATGNTPATIHYVHTGERSGTRNLAFLLSKDSLVAPKWCQKEVELFGVEGQTTRFGKVMAKNNIKIWKVALPSKP